MITSIILVNNEEENIVSCIKKLSWTDEIVVVDNDSTDKTPEAAKKNGAVVITVKGKDFAKMRSMGAEKAHGKWLLYIDTDEEVSESLKKEILEIVKNFNESSNPHAYVLKRRNYYLGHLWPFSDGMIRLIYKSSLERWFGELHETAEIHGDVGVLENPLIHKTHKTLEDMLAQTNEWSEVEAELRLKQHHPKIVSWRLFRVMWTGFYGSYIIQEGFKAGTVGLIESVYQAFSMFTTYAKLWEMQRNIKSNEI